MRFILNRIMGFGLLLLLFQCVAGGATKKDDTNAFHYYSRALEAYNTHDLKTALVFIDQAISANSHIAGYYKLKGDIFAANKLYDNALLVYGKALQYRSNYVVVQIKIADIYFYRKEFIRARQNYEKAMALAPDNKELNLRLAECILQSREYGVLENVLNDYKRLFTAPSADTSYDVLLARSAFEQKKYPLAVKYAQLAVAGKTHQRTLFLVYLRALFYTRANEDAYDLLLHGAKSYLKKTDSHFFRGLYFAQQHNRDDALVQLQMAIDGGTTIYEAYDLLAGFLPEPRASEIRALGEKWKNGRLINGGQ